VTASQRERSVAGGSQVHGLCSNGKADTETIPIAYEVGKLQTVVGQANGGRERWAFAFSAMQSSADKVRSDVRGAEAKDDWTLPLSAP
jgi:hypothetical protein